MLRKSNIFYFTLNNASNNDKIRQRIFERIQACSMANKRGNKKLFYCSFSDSYILWCLSLCC